MYLPFIQNLILLNEKLKKIEHGEDNREAQQLLLRSTCLIGALLHLSNTLLPTALCAELQATPTLVSSAISFGSDPGMRSHAGSMVSNLERYSIVTRTGDGSNKLAYFQEIKKKLDLTMDEALIRQRFTDTVSFARFTDCYLTLKVSKSS